MTFETDSENAAHILARYAHHGGDIALSSLRSRQVAFGRKFSPPLLRPPLRTSFGRLSGPSLDHGRHVFLDSLSWKQALSTAAPWATRLYFCWRVALFSFSAYLDDEVIPAFCT